jgi:hypothetical protein
VVLLNDQWVWPSTTRPNRGGIGVEEREGAQEKVEAATADMYPDADPDLKEEGPQQGADTGPGLKKGQAPPPGSTGKEEDTVQTPPT